MHYVYWIHDENETDLLTEGYVGISNDPDRRFGEHGDKFGTVKEVLFSFEDRTDAEEKEKELRPSWYIGKNIAPGGQAGNRPRGIHTSGWTHTEEGRRNKSKALMGNQNARNRAVETEFDGITFRSKYEAESYRKEKYGDLRKNNGQNQKTRRCVVDGVEYEGQNEAARLLGWTNGKVRTRCLSKNYPDCYFIE